MTSTAAHIALAYARIREAGAPAGTWTYIAVRPADLPSLVRHSDAAFTVEACDLILSPEIAATTTAQLAAPIRRATVIVGTVVDGVWATGPLAGQAAP